MQCNIIGINNTRTRRTATIALNRRGWHWKYELQQLGGHATGTEGNEHDQYTFF